jgi:hyperosmotically inducible protein
MKITNHYGQKVLADRAFAIACLSIALGLAACQQEGAAEKAGKKIDRAVENADQKYDLATTKADQKIEAAKESVTDKSKIAGEYIDDSVITTKVKTAILNELMLNASHIEVTTENGVVTLSGTVDSKPMIGRALELANSQNNVKSVKTNLIVNVPGPGKL